MPGPLKSTVKQDLEFGEPNKTKPIDVVFGEPDVRGYVAPPGKYD